MTYAYHRHRYPLALLLLYLPAWARFEWMNRLRVT